ncbi:chemotaxis protein CheW, partial [Pseudomonas sp. NPDC086278]|uniref:chemotaxis protein CheW n=1 Tax=Pseudomonas sp. NPDC086278 TaxID=3390646 RepID=UPI003D035CF0
RAFRQRYPDVRYVDLIALDIAGSSAAHEEQREGHVVILSVGTQRIGFVVDQLVGQEEVVIKPLGKMLQGTPGMSGATITGDGRIALILDVPSMLKRYAARRI